MVHEVKNLKRKRKESNVLVLERKVGEKVFINNGEIIVEISQIKKDGKIVLGFTAPKNIPIHREEVQIEIDKEKENRT